MLAVLLSVLALPLVTSPRAPAHAPPRKLQVAEGVFVFQTAPYSDVGLDGNSVVILSREGVLVFDANGTPAAAEAVLAEVRRMTRQPVRYLVLSHWHWDHWYGAEVYRRAFPDVRIVVTGDLLVNPIPFALGCYPSGLLATLERIDALAADVIVPGHGDPLRDKTLLETHIALFRALLRESREAKARGLDVEQARAAVAPAIAALGSRLAGGDARLAQQFDLFAVDWFLHRVYDELDGRLTDDIAPIPRH